MKRLNFVFLFIVTFSAMAQNPSIPPGLNIADPTAKVWKDCKLYVYGSRDDNPKTYCSHDHWVLSTDDWSALLRAKMLKIAIFCDF